MNSLHIHPATARAFRSGERPAFEQIFRQHFPALCFFAGRLLPDACDPQDLVMDCFVKLWEKRAGIHYPDAIRTFLYVTVRHACIDHLRKKKPPFACITEETVAVHADPAGDFIEVLIRAETLRRLFAEAESLPLQIKKVFQLHFIHGKTEQEISRELGRSRHTIRSQRQRAVILLRKKLLCYSK